MFSTTPAQSGSRSVLCVAFLILLLILSLLSLLLVLLYLSVLFVVFLLLLLLLLLILSLLVVLLTCLTLLAVLLIFLIASSFWFRCFVFVYLSNATCLIRPRLLRTLFVVSRITIMRYINCKLCRTTRVRQVVLDKCFPLKSCST